MTEDRKKIAAISSRIISRHRRTINRCLLFVCTCLIALSCNRPLYEHYQTMNGGMWEKDKEYFFTFDIKDTTVAYDLKLEVRNDNLYPFQNLWVLSHTLYPDSTAQRDTTECILADDFGKWYGKGMSVFQFSQPLRSRFYFPQSGTYTIGFRQGMRQDELPGVQSIGLRVEEAW